MVKVEESKKFAPIVITLETEKEANLFHHIVNFCPDKEKFYDMKGYVATFEEVDRFRSSLWNEMQKVHQIEMKEDC